MVDYIPGIHKTGFILENKIVQELKLNKWTVISNKYYEDDIGDTVREIDILAYKISKVDGVDVYTSLLISCKKSEENAWILLSRDINLKDVNSNWWPLHIWTNDASINDFLKEDNSNKQYYEFTSEKKGVKAMHAPSVDVFAFQEMNKIPNKNGISPQNDKNIYSSLTTLMKAQSYEIGALHGRKKNKAIYHFNLISVIESDLIRLNIQDEEITQEEIETEQLVARYIIRKKEEFFRIRFITSTAFKEYIKSYNELHKVNVEFFKKEMTSFYKDAVKNYRKIQLLKDDFFSLITKHIQKASNYKISLEVARKNIDVIWDYGKEYLRIYVTDDEKMCAILKADEDLNVLTEKYLLQVFRYNGKFEYSTDDLPF